MAWCGVSESFGDGSAQVKLPTSRVTFFVRDVLPGFSREEFEAACMEAWKRWERVIGIKVDKHPNGKTDCTQIVTVANLGGPSGVLADQMLPYGTGVNLRMRVDSTERWIIADNPPAGRINLLGVLCHEDGHCLGLQHILPEGDRDLMNASYEPRIFEPQEDDISYGRKLYGPPGNGATPPVPPLGDSLGLEIIITQQNARYKATGTAKRIA